MADTACAWARPRRMLTSCHSFRRTTRHYNWTKVSLFSKAATPAPVGTPIAQRPGDSLFVINGEYPEIMALVRALANGPAAKEELDVVIDQCSQMQNLRCGVLR